LLRIPPARGNSRPLNAEERPSATGTIDEHQSKIESNQSIRSLRLLPALPPVCVRGILETERERWMGMERRGEACVRVALISLLTPLNRAKKKIHANCLRELVGWDYERMEGVHVSDTGYTCWIPTR
jgi:hypothetical protein